MPEKKLLVSISYITDTETPVYNLGEVDGYFDQDELEHFIDCYGANDLLLHLAKLTARVVESNNAVEMQKSFAGVGVQCNVDPVMFYHADHCGICQSISEEIK